MMFKDVFRYYCPHCGEVLVPEKDLPVRLPIDVKFDAGAKSPLATSVPAGQVMASDTAPAMEWLTWINSTEKQPS